MKKQPLARRRTCASPYFTAKHDRGGKADLANTALKSNEGLQVPPPSADRPLHCRLCVPRGPPDRRGKPSEMSSCRARAIAFCGFGTTRSSPISTASSRRSPTSSAGSPPPKPSSGALPLDGGGLGGGDASRRPSREMKKQPLEGAHARARTLR